MNFTKQIPLKMFSLRVLSIFWLSSSVIMLGGGVQCFFRMNLFGEGGEYLSHDSAPWIDRNFSNLQQNNHDDEQNHMVPSTYPVSLEYSNQKPEEDINWGAVDISPLDELFNHPDSGIQFENQQEQYQGGTFPHSDYINYKNLIDQPSNFQEAITNFNQGDLWNFTPFEDLSFSGPNHQKETNPLADSSQHQSSSSNIIQPTYDGDLLGRNHINKVPYIYEFPYPDSSFVLPLYQNGEILHDEQISQNPNFHITQNELSYGPHLSDMRNRVNQNRDREVLKLNPASSSHNSGFRNTGAEIDHRRNSIENEISIVVTPNKEGEGKEAQENFGAEESYKGMLDLIDILENEFSKCSKEKARKFSTYRHNGILTVLEKSKYQEEEAKYQKYIDKRILVSINGKKHRDKETARLDVSKIYRRKKFRLIENVFRIQWDNIISLKVHILVFAKKIVKNRGKKDMANPEHIVKISIMGITYMKIISKLYAKKEASKEFGDDKNLIDYTIKFWDHCFTKHSDMNEALRSFFKSIRTENRRHTVNRFIYSLGNFSILERSFTIPNYFPRILLDLAI
ncbi:hypothetical protein PPACK8108_LOCUS2370, partial [Phakopsora pachyrhizi]